MRTGGLRLIWSNPTFPSEPLLLKPSDKPPHRHTGPHTQAHAPHRHTGPHTKAHAPPYTHTHTRPHTCTRLHGQPHTTLHSPRPPTLANSHSLTLRPHSRSLAAPTQPLRLLAQHPASPFVSPPPYRHAAGRGPVAASHDNQ